jgi:serine/threonine-protein phosphatase 4 regulatory subunit 1
MSEQDSKDKIIEDTKPKEEISTINTTNPNSINDSQDSSQHQAQNEQQEQAELSEVETGNKNQPDFEEMINFNHTYLNYRIAKSFPDKVSLDSSTFELLMTNVFIYSGDIIDFKAMTSLSNTDAVKNIRQKIYKYKDDDLTNKITFIENVPFYVKTVGFQEAVESILPIINELPREKENLAVRFFNVFPKFVDEIVNFGDKGYFILKDHMIKLIGDFLTNNSSIYKKNLNLVTSISDGLVYMTKFIKDEDKGESVLTIVIKMAQDDDDDHKREKAMRLFGDLTPLVDTDLIQLYVIPQVNSFADDHSGNVRKEVANQLSNISQKVSKEIFKRRILPVYKKLSKDTLWNVKKAAAEILPKITKLCDSDIISKDIIPIFKSFAQDEKPIVKNAAVEVFGEFISLINKDDAANFVELLDFYVETIQRLTTKGKRDERAIIQKCAYNFPAVLLFFGKNYWEKLKPSFALMANEKDEKIKLPLASSLGEISNIIGSELTESDLLEFVDKFFKNSPQNSELKIKILKVLPDIIKNIPSNRKNAYLEFIKYMIGNKDDKWRKRVTYSKIIGKFNGTYSDNIIYKRVFPIAINFCFDDISQVRSNSAKHNSRLILQLISSKTEFKNKTLTIIKSFAQSINYRYRQLFVYMCRHLFENEEVFNECISELLLDLAYDQIPNVKIVLAKFISELVNKDKEKYANVAKNETVRKIVKVLKNDKNREVIAYMEKVKNVEDIEVELEKNVNIKFKDNMKFVSSEFGITRNVPLNSIFKENKFTEKKEEPVEKKEETPGKNEETPQKKEETTEKKEEPAERKEEPTEKKEEKKENSTENKEEDKKEENKPKEEEKKEESS